MYIYIHNELHIYMYNDSLAYCVSCLGCIKINIDNSRIDLRKSSYFYFQLNFSLAVKRRRSKLEIQPHDSVP